MVKKKKLTLNKRINKKGLNMYILKILAYTVFGPSFKTSLVQNAGLKLL